jgi:tetratricopeptide (TPR) repeat protein
MILALCRLCLAALALIGLAAPAAAEWHKAESEHFVIYSDSSSADIREFAQRLERYHVAMTKLTGFNPPPPSPSNRVTVYAVGSDRTLKKLYGDTGSRVAGFYIPRAGSSVAFVPNVRLSGNQTDFTMIVLLHEYAHHFTISANPFPMPRWVTEGMAEFFAAAKFAPDGGIDIGLPANHRSGELNFADKLSIRELLDYDRYAAGRNRSDAFYGQSWLLFHYLAFNPQRQSQYSDYMTRFLRGTPSLEAAEQAFGDLGQLEAELKSYQRNRRIPAQRYSADLLPIGPVEVASLSEGMNAMMDVVLQSRRGVDREKALDILPEARAVAARYPEDPGVLAALAEAEFDAGNDAEAIAAADRAIARDSAQHNAYVQKGYALFRIAEEAEDKDGAITAAMRPFEALNAIEADHPLPLIYYFRSFAERGSVPNDNARAALRRASELAPFDQDLRLNLALMQIADRKHSEARQTLAPLAADPHGSGRSGRAKQLMTLLEQTPDGTRLDTSALKAQMDAPDAQDEES